MRAWDLLVLLACLVALFLSFPSMQTYRLQPVWEIPMDAAAAYRNGHTPEEWEKLPPVIATDLDGDGYEDLVYVTADYHIRVVDGWSLQDLEDERPGDARHDTHSSVTSALHLMEPPPAFEASLLPKFAIKYGRRPVAMETGYLDPEDDEDHDRRQVIVVLTESWIVMCFSSSLELLWESHAVDEPDPLTYFKEASITISPTPVRNGDRGLVVVAGRMTPIDKEPEAGHEHFDKEEFEAIESDLMKEMAGAGLEDMEESARTKLKERLRERQMEDARLAEEREEYTQALQHFSFYAFEGHSGESRWQHTPADYRADRITGKQNTRHKILEAVDESDTAVRNHLLKNMRHIGEQPWFTFADDILDELPHAWHGREYTDIKPAHFSRDRSSGGAPDAVGWDDEDDLFGSDVISQYYAPEAYFKKNKVKTPPANVVVAHNEDGIEVLHYYTGRPLTGIKMDGGSTYADINGDQLIDKLEVVPKLISPEGARHCLALARTGLPAQEVIFEVELCEDTQSKKRRNKLKIGKDVRTTEANVHMLPPVVVPRDRFTSNLVYLMSNGRIVCLSEHGDQLWATQTTLTWRDPSTINKQSLGKNFVLKGSHPSLSIIPRSDGALSHHLLAVGANAIAIVSAKTGAVEYTSALPAMPIGPVVFADWDQNGASDFLLPTGAAHIAFMVEPTAPGYFLFPAVVLLLILIVLFMACATSGNRKKSHDNRYGM